ncbi:AAA family ATPase [Phytoactinopolyspora limicola]|uniref:AAA family ATPase n=1 Tax=Phytoactinopolyspora limicola TaxID=2715536 RepID=UPI0014097031|nr:chromosome partitioning protein [Phytoactinopolyspora limicola]
MSQLQVLVAASGTGWDAQLVQRLETAPSRIAVARRCVDLADLLAAAGAGLGQAVLVPADLRRLDREALAVLQRGRVGVVGVLPGAEAAADRLRLTQLGVRHVVSVDAATDTLTAAILAAVADAEVAEKSPGSTTRGATDPATTGIEDAIRAGGGSRAGDADASAIDFIERGGERGRLIAVWGPCGAPGRTTLAVNIAMESALIGQSTMLIDADTYGASVAQALGLLDEAPGLAGAARLANSGQLDVISLARYARRITPQLHVLTGIVRPSRWTELRASALDAVWEQTRLVSAVTVVDCGFCLEEDESISFDSAAPRRNAATLSTLRAADAIVVVAAGDPIGLGRLVRGLDELAEVAPDTAAHVVVNRVRSSVAGADAEQQIAAALNRYAGRTPYGFVPYDPQALDAALLSGLTLAETTPRSPARQAIRELAGRMLGAAAAPSRRLARLRR